VRTVVRDQLAEVKTLVQDELVEAKGLLRAEINEAEDKVRKGLSDAKQAITTDVKQAVSDAKASVRAATIGKVEDLATTLGDNMNDARDSLIDTIRNTLSRPLSLGSAWRGCS
jgi:F0F1-type ATP synthase membrane subunit b/b'